MKKILLFIVILCFSFSASALYEEVDLHAKNVPLQYEKKLETLVDYLIKPYRNDDRLKARAIYAWIGYNVEYDMYKYKSIMGEQKGFYSESALRTGDAFKTRIGVCGDIADLYRRMARKAGLKVEIITGYAGKDLTMENFKDAGHAWNAIFIDRKWYFVDATWGMSGNYQTNNEIQSAAQHRRDIRKRKRQNEFKELKNRSIEDKWFLVDPKIMIETHFPRREKDQHLSKPVKMKKVFRENARRLEGR